MLVLVAAIGIVLGALLVLYALSTRNPRLEARARKAELGLRTYRQLVLSLQDRLGKYSDTDPVAASLLDDIIAVTSGDQQAYGLTGKGD